MTDGDSRRARVRARSTRPTLAGVPDEFQRLWTPHRMAYIQPGPQPLRDACPFCAAPEMSDEDVAHRRPRARPRTCCSTCSRTTPATCSSARTATSRRTTRRRAEEVAEIGALTQRAMRVAAAGVALRRLQHRHEPGARRRRGHRRAPAPAHRAALGARRELLPDHRRRPRRCRSCSATCGRTIADAWPA